jgi:hypothetical protein
MYQTNQTEMLRDPVDLMWVCVTGILMWRLVPRLAIDGDTVNGHGGRRGDLAKNEQEYERRRSVWISQNRHDQRKMPP